MTDPNPVAPVASIAVEADRSYSTTEVAKLLQVSTQTVQKWVDQGHLVAWKTVGGHRRISGDSVQRFLTQQAIAGSGSAGTSVSNRHNRRVPVREVLLVEDDEYERDLMYALLAIHAPTCHVHTANNGFHALLQLGRALPDLLITDLMMGGLDGLEMLRALASDTRTAKLPAIAVSGLSAEEVAARGGIPRSVRLLPKPVDPLLLGGIIAELWRA